MSKEWILSVALAALMVAGFLYFKNENNTGGTMPTKASPAAIVPGKPPEPENGMLTETYREGEIVKCTVNGKTTYSNSDCGAGQKKTKVTIIDTAGVVSPSREQIDSTLARLRQERLIEANSQAAQGKVMVIGKAEQAEFECEAINNHIANLDASARQPQTAQMQDWLAREKKKATSRKYSLQC
jgi:hypothetical protein